ncbi:alpha/beta fold hydrolase [Actinomadura opuntiae]|uniref:alpha/beta fold hydrolase n=1 Tax=Actinomadura sp. OS1-43 TaxID=604315 RepID=UPI00255B240B|nr:alpha/beta hydrolase [Actinomadura sp. OS1-43]MDL4821286.1 alpha/beta hydrolase [Actinomadura sp. OS1-43]
MESFIEVDGAALCVETFGEKDDAPVLLVGNTMLTWPDDLCGRLAALRRFVIRYDLRGTGRSADTGSPGLPVSPGTDSETDSPEKPNSGGGTLRGLVSDAVGILDAYGLAKAHVVGFGPGGWVAQLLALDHPGRVATLTLIATRPTAPGPSDPDLPEHAPEVMARAMNPPAVDWTDRASVVGFMVENARRMAGAGFDEAEARANVERIHDRTEVADDPGAAHRADQMAGLFGALDCGPRWRERLGAIAAPTLVVHGEDDPFFPLGNGRALAAEIPRAELLVLPGTGYEIPRRTWDVLVSALLRHTS